MITSELNTDVSKERGEKNSKYQLALQENGSVEFIKQKQQASDMH